MTSRLTNRSLVIDNKSTTTRGSAELILDFGSVGFPPPKKRGISSELVRFGFDKNPLFGSELWNFELFGKRLMTIVRETYRNYDDYSDHLSAL